MEKLNKQDLQIFAQLFTQCIYWVLAIAVGLFILSGALNKEFKTVYGYFVDQKYRTVVCGHEGSVYYGGAYGKVNFQDGKWSFNTPGGEKFQTNATCIVSQAKE